MDSIITNNQPGLTVSYHETEADAQTGAQPITTTSYCNLQQGIDTVWVKVYANGTPDCASFTSMQLQVNPVPMANPLIADYELCDENAPGDGIEAFDLETMTATILNNQTGVVVTYHLSESEAQNDTGAIDTSILYNNVTPGGEPMWIRLENNITGCFSVDSFNLVVNPLPGVVEPGPMTACSNGPTNIAEFDLLVNNNTVSGGAAGTIVTYHYTLADAQNGVGPLAIPYTSDGNNPQTVYVRVENSDTGCFDTTTLVLNVAQGPLAITPAPLQQCDPNSNCFTEFDLTQAFLEISGGSIPAGVVMTVHETYTDAVNGASAITDVTSYPNIVACLQTVFVRVSYEITGCSNIVELQLIVNPTPQATEIDPLQVCDTDTDGIGTFNLNAATPQILGSLDASAHTVAYYLSQDNAQTGTEPIAGLEFFNNTTPFSQTIWVSVTNTATGCFDVIPLGLIVNPLPLAPMPAVSPLTLCDYNNPGDEVEIFDLSTKIPEILMNQTGMEVAFYFSQADALLQVSPLPLLYPNADNAQTIWITVTNAATGCFVITTMDLRVEPLPTLIKPSGPVVKCDADDDCFAEFDLTELVSDMLQSAPNITVTFHETLTDAQTGNTSIANPGAYTNVVECVQPIWVRAQDDLTGCWSVIDIELNVIRAPEMPTLTDLTSCDEDSDPQDGQTNFNLTEQTPVILAAQSGPAADYTVEYFISQNDADTGTAPIIPADNFTNGPNPQTIFVRVTKIDGECYTTGTFELIVNTPLALITPAPLSLCDDGPTTAIPQTSFDLTVKDAEITQNLSGYTVTYYPSFAQALAGTGAISDTDAVAYTNQTNPQTLGVVVTSALGCASYTTMDIRVLPLPTPMIDPEPLEACDDNLPQGTEMFDLTVNQSYIADDDPNLTFEYYPSQQAAISGTGQIIPATAYEGSGSVWIKVINAQASSSGDNCYVLVEQQLIVNPLPDVALNTTYTFCDTSNTGTGTFILSSVNDQVLLPPQDPDDFIITYHLTQADAQTGTGPLADSYTINTTQNVYAHVENILTGCVNATGVVTLTVAAGAIAASPAPYAVCDTDTDGVLNIDLATLFSTTVLAGQAPAGFSVTYYPTQADALAGTGALTPSSYDAQTGTIYAVVTNTTTLCPSTPAPIQITIEPLAKPVISAVGNNICVEWGTNALISGLTLDSGLDPADYSFQWLLNNVAITGATGATFDVTDPVNGAGDYTVVATSLSALGCVSAPSPVFTVIKSGPAVAIGQGYSVSNAFGESQTITILVNGYGNYVYSLDGGPFVNNGGIFTDVSPGPHTVVVMDSNQNSCGQITINAINAINYPPYFTPNGDGIHDTWNIIGMETQPSTKIYIFDRYGKLLKQISSTGNGWDGTFNGQPLPSTDYWFTVQYSEQGVAKEFKAHFSLKR
jgi:gliding motility-associated-like protein